MVVDALDGVKVLKKKKVLKPVASWLARGPCRQPGLYGRIREAVTSVTADSQF